MHPVLHKLLSQNRTINGGRDLNTIKKMLPWANGVSFPSVHVAGTNGKGSVSFKIAQVLQNAGYKVGLYTSPHIHNYTERISINGIEIDEQDAVKWIEELYIEFKNAGIEPHFFEMTTLLTFRHFNDKKIDIGIIETGIGGRNDPTNVIDPLVSIVTSLGLDHQEMIGPTLKEIAYEKAGVIKERTPIVLGPRVPLPFFEETAKAFKAPLAQVHGIAPCYDLENQATAAKALSFISPLFPFNNTHLTEGLLRRPPCRFEILHRKEGVVVFDVAHNPEGFTRLFEWWEQQQKEKPTLILGMAKTKDLKTCLMTAKPFIKSLYPICPDPMRCYSAQDIALVAVELGIQQVEISNSLESAIQRATYPLLIAGTFNLMAEAKRVL